MANLNITPEKTGLDATANTPRGTAAVTGDKVVLAEITDSNGGDLLNVLEKGGVLTVGSNTPIPSEDTSWIRYRTDLTAAELKLRTGTEGSYSYAASRRLFTGASRAMAYYHTSDTPPSLTLTWDSNNDDPNVTGGGWTLDHTGAKWVHFAFMQRDVANTVYVVPRMRIGDPTADNISITLPDGTGNFPRSVNTLQELVNWIFSTAEFGGSGGGGSFTQQPSDWDSTTNPTQILNKPLVAQTGQFNPTGTADDLNLDSHPIVETNVRIDPAWVTYSSEYNTQLAIHTLASVYFEGISAMNPVPEVTVKYEVLNADGSTVFLSEQSVIRIPDTNRASRPYRITGLIPLATMEVKLRVTYISRQHISSPLGLGWVGTFDWSIGKDLDAASIAMNPNAYGGLLRADAGLRNVAEAFNQVDEIPAALADNEDLTWAANIDLSESLPGSRQQTIPIHQLIQDFNANPLIQYVVRMIFHAAHGGGDGPTIGYQLAVHSDLNNYATLLSTPTDTVDGTGRDNLSEFAIPAGTQNVRFTYNPPVDSGNNPISQGAARLNITNFKIVEITGVDTTGFSDAGITNTKDHSPQAIAKKINDAKAAQIPVDNNAFSNPSRYLGGLREPTTGTIPALPTNQQETDVKIDYLIRQAYQAYHQTWKLHRHVGGTVYSSTFSLGASNPSEVSEQVIIKPLLRRYAIDADGDIEIILHLSTTAVSADANITIGLWSATTGGTQYGNDFLLTGSSGTAGSRTTSGNAAIFRMTLPANSADQATTTNVPANFYVRFNRTAGSATITDGFLDLDRITQEGASGGVGGGADSEWEVIWEAGPNFSDRLTTVSGSVLRHLKTGKRFDQFSEFVLQYDTNAAAGVGIFAYAPEPAIKMMIDGSFTGNGGSWIHLAYSFYKLLKANNQTSMYFLGGSEIGYRKLWAR